MLWSKLRIHNTKQIFNQINCFNHYDFRDKDVDDDIFQISNDQMSVIRNNR